MLRLYSLSVISRPIRDFFRRGLGLQDVRAAEVFVCSNTEYQLWKVSSSNLRGAVHHDRSTIRVSVALCMSGR